MRLTRAAFRAQEEAAGQGDDPFTDSKITSPVKSIVFVREDSAERDLEITGDDNDHIMQHILRDITLENYPSSDCDVPTNAEQVVVEERVRTDTPINESKAHILRELDIDPEQVQQDATDLRKSTREKGKKRKLKFRKAAEIVTEHHDQGTACKDDDNIACATYQNSEAVPETLLESLQTSLPHNNKVQTPHFDPSIHIVEDLPQQESATVDDSFIPSITSRSPAKYTQPQTEAVSPVAEYPPSSKSLQSGHCPLRRVSSTRSDIENSIEAMDKFEDEMEQITTAITPQKEPAVAENAIKSAKSTFRIASTKKPVCNTKVVRTPGTAGKRLQQAGDKEVKQTPARSSTNNTPSKTPATKTASTPALKSFKTPKTTRAQQLRMSTLTSARTTPSTATVEPEALVPNTPVSKTPAKVEDIAVRKNTPATTPRVEPAPTTVQALNTPVTRTPVARKESGLRAHIASTRKAMGQPSPSSAESSVKNIAAIFETASAPAKPSSPQRVVAELVSVHDKLPEVTHEHNQPEEVSEAISEPETKQRSTSTAVLIKPAFVPQKSTKPPTTSNFRLPGEIAAEKLKMQKEAREARMAAPGRPSAAEDKAAKLRADREAREARVKQNQEKARTASAEDKPKPVVKTSKPLSTSVKPSIAPRLNKASEARISRVFSDNSTSDKENTAPVRTSNISHVRSKTESLSVNKTRTHQNRSSVAVMPSANKENVRNVSLMDPVTTAKLNTMSSGARLQVSQADIVAQKARGKEVANRAKTALKQEKVAQKEAQEAAKKARAEAAERGRQASREWAERMRAKKAVSQAVPTDA